MSDVKGPARRQYRSTLREEGARRTRQAIVAAARQLFLRHGYLATSLADVAAEAGVARPTVFAAFGSKPALLKQVLDEALAGDDEPVPVAQRPWFQPIWQASTPEQVLEAYADVCVLIAQRAAAFFEIVRRAADGSPEVAELWQTARANRRAGARMVIEHAAKFGPLAPERTHDQAVDLMWVLNDPAHYAALVEESGWPVAAYRDWLATTMRRTLLPG